MTTFPNWQEVGERLFERTLTVIRQIESEHPDTIISFFAFYAEPIQGLFEFHVDTPENATHMAIKREQEVFKERQQMLNHSWSWKQAHYYTDLPRLLDYSYSVEYFQFHVVDTLVFDEWLTFFDDNDEYPKGKEGVDDDYLEGNTRILLWRLTERLIEHNAFARLRLASPFRIGFQFHDNELVILRILNWPQ